MRIRAELSHEKDAPKSHAYGFRTDDGVLIKVWVPKALVRDPIEVVLAEIEIPIEKGKKSKKKRKQRDEEDDDEED